MVHGVRNGMVGTLQFRVSEAFSFNKPDEWLKWHKRFEQFRVASGLSAEGQARQVSTLLYRMGEEAEDVLTYTYITTDEKKDYETVLGKFNEYFKVCKSSFLRGARFNWRNQLKGESAEQYITDLYRLAETCEYGDMTSQMLRNWLVICIQNFKLSEHLQMDPNLTLEKVKIIRQSEAVQEHHAIFQQAGNSVVEQIHHKKRSSGTQS